MKGPPGRPQLVEQLEDGIDQLAVPEEAFP